jgi:YfiH family protein
MEEPADDASLATTREMKKLVRKRLPQKKSAVSKAGPARKSFASGKNAEWRPRKVRGLQLLESPNLTKQSWLVHGFSTRPGGASKMEITTARARPGKMAEKVLNLGFTDWDSRASVLRNRAAFIRAIGAETMRVVTLRQIHSDIVRHVDRASLEDDKEAPKADALITREAGILLAVQTADCIPVLLADTKNRAVAAIHSGWRGTLKRIAEKALGRMRVEFGTRPSDVIAAIGPGIGLSCYEVGSEVARDFDAKFPNAREWFEGPYDALASGESDPNWLPWLTMKPPGHAPPPLRVRLDLVAANRAILAAAGVRANSISSSDFCTACRSDLFFSYRREHTTGRMMAVIGIR